MNNEKIRIRIIKHGKRYITLKKPVDVNISYDVKLGMYMYTVDELCLLSMGKTKAKAKERLMEDFIEDFDSFMTEYDKNLSTEALVIKRRLQNLYKQEYEITAIKEN